MYIYLIFLTFFILFLGITLAMAIIENFFNFRKAQKKIMRINIEKCMTCAIQSAFKCMTKLNDVTNRKMTITVRPDTRTWTEL